MAKSPTERITAIERLVDTHILQLDTLTGNLDRVYGTHSELSKEVRELDRVAVLLRHEVDELKKWQEEVKEVSLLKREVEELKKWKEEVKKGDEEWGRKLWMIVPPILAVLASSVLALLITLFVKK